MTEPEAWSSSAPEALLRIWCPGVSGDSDAGRAEEHEEAFRPADYRTGAQWLRFGICWPIVRCGNVGTVDALAV
jgi:hypothetical protein